MDIFITGTDTDIGKTFVTAGLSAVMQSLGYDMGVYKPVQSGAEVQEEERLSPDIEFVKKIDPNIRTKCSYNFIEPVAPSLAAQVEKKQVRKEIIENDYAELKSKSDILITEGAGGLLVPVAKNLMISDIAKFLELPILIVARPDLGTINHTLLTINVAKSLGLKVIGVVINKYPQNPNLAIKHAARLITEYSDTKVLGVIPKINMDSNNPLFGETLIDATLKNTDLAQIFNLKIPKLSIWDIAN